MGEGKHVNWQQFQHEAHVPGTPTTRWPTVAIALTSESELTRMQLCCQTSVFLLERWCRSVWYPQWSACNFNRPRCAYKHLAHAHNILLMCLYSCSAGYPYHSTTVQLPIQMYILCNMYILYNMYTVHKLVFMYMYTSCTSCMYTYTMVPSKNTEVLGQFIASSPGHSQILSRSYGENWEKAWEHCYVTDRECWTQFVLNESTISTVSTNQVHRFWSVM